jgi:hypothetical protein
MTAELITGDSPDGVTHVVIDGIVEHGEVSRCVTASAQGTPGALLVPAVKV